MHPLEKLAEDWRNGSAAAIRVEADSHGEIRVAETYEELADELDAVLASLWHPFDPDDEGTWPAIHDGISTVHQVTFDDNTVGVGYLIAHSGNWQTWTYRERRNVTHYTELLPGPRAEKSNG